MTTNERVARGFLWLMLGLAVGAGCWFAGYLIGGLAS